MDGFDKEQAFGGPKNPEYVYVPHTESKPYFDMAHEWVVAIACSSRTSTRASFRINTSSPRRRSPASIFPPATGAATADRATRRDHYAAAHVSADARACFDYQTLGDELDTAKLTWRFYTSNINDFTDCVWSGYQAVRHIRYGPDWKQDVITPQKQFITDVAAGTLANVTWITPTCANSDHVNCGGGFGPSWVTSLVNAVGKSQFWDSTAIFVMWDDWGGLYDHVPPPHLDYDGLGFRVPLLVISPYAKQTTFRTSSTRPAASCGSPRTCSD